MDTHVNLSERITVLVTQYWLSICIKISVYSSMWTWVHFIKKFDYRGLDKGKKMFNVNVIILWWKYVIVISI